MNVMRIKHESFCHACLSTDRPLSTATKYVDICYKIMDIHNMAYLNEFYLCWECISNLKKISMFKTKFAEAQRILQFYYTNKRNPFPHSLSNLTSHTNTNQIYLQHEEIETKAIKEEIDNYEDFDHFDTDNIEDEPESQETPNITELATVDIVETIPETSLFHHIDTDNIKDEPESEETPNITKQKKKKTKVDIVETVPVTSLDWKELSKKRNMKRKAKYRFVNAKLRKHRSLLVRKMPTELGTVMSLLKEERGNVSFLKAEYKCVGCVAVWSDRDGLEKHYKKYHEEAIGPYQCKICKIRCQSHTRLETHQRKHYYRRECKVCRLRCCSESIMSRHLEEHNRMVQCVACELCFKNTRLFYMHYRALHASFVCDVCGKRCKSRALIEKHLRYHFGYECPHCKKKFKSSSSYKNHVETHASSVSDNSYCVQCDRRFSTNRMYKRHLQSSSAHAAEKDNTRENRKYPCPECSNVYSRRAYMNNHYRHVHAKQSNYYCEDCDRHFLNRTRYLEHRRFKHEGVQREKNKLCNICGRGFAANRTLENHIRTHSGERPFSCDFCNAKFTQKHAMLSHVKYIHLKSKRKPSSHESQSSAPYMDHAELSPHVRAMCVSLYDRVRT